MISDYFDTKSVTDRILTQLIRELKDFPSLNNWLGGRIFKSVGSIAAQDESIAVPFCFVLPDTESEKTSPSRNSNIEMSFGIALCFETPSAAIPDDEMTVASVVDAIKGYLYSKQSLVETGTGQVLTQRIGSFNATSYDTIAFDDGEVLGVCPVTVTYLLSVKTVSRQPSISTT